jgi:hypothetical protein
MALAKRFFLAITVLALAAPIALAGPNAGGVLVVHATNVVYSSGMDYAGQSVIGCGQDLPALPSEPVCPPYDPNTGAIPCLPNAANPSMSTLPAEGEAFIWYVMAAFPQGSCPKLKGVSFRFDYDPAKVFVIGSGTDAGNFALDFPSDNTGDPFPASGSGVGVSFSTEMRTGWLSEVYWFAGYTDPAASDVTWSLRVKSAVDNFFVGDGVPAAKDPIAALGVLGFGATPGNNPQVALPVETKSWGQVKATYGTR